MKHLKSSSRELRDMFENSISVSAICQKLECCDAEDDATEILKRWKSRILMSWASAKTIRLRAI